MPLNPLLAPDPLKEWQAIASARYESIVKLHAELTTAQEWNERYAIELRELREQEPVAEVKMVDHIYRIHWKKCPPDDGTLLYDRPVPAAQAVPDGWLERGREALVEARRNEDLWEDDTLLAHLFAKMIAAAPKEHHQPPATDGEALLFEAEAKRSRP